MRERRSCLPTTTRQCGRSPLERSPRMGYNVLAAANGREALQLVQPDMRIDLLVTDLDMPGLSGRELATELGHLPVLYMSGHPQGPARRRPRGRGPLIQKPSGWRTSRRLWRVSSPDGLPERLPRKRHRAGPQRKIRDYSWRSGGRCSTVSAHAQSTAHRRRVAAASSRDTWRACAGNGAFTCDDRRARP